MFKKKHLKIKSEEKKIKTESGKRLYALIREDLSHSRRMKRILSRAAASLFIVVIIILLVMYFV